MQRNFILTDVMKTGDHLHLENFISMHSLSNQQFEMTGEYYTLHNYDIDSFDRRFAIIDVKQVNKRLNDSREFHGELTRRCRLLASQGFVFIKATPWESVNNINNSDIYPEIDIEHVKWSGGISWFWFFMFQKHKDRQYNFNHNDKKFEFLYLNKSPRAHRKRLYEKAKPLMSNSLCTNWAIGMKLPRQYELPWVKTYPDRGMDQDLYEKPYNDTKYSLISETNDTDDEVFMTEKIWKAIIAQHVFIVHGNYLYLQKLREIGFKTFGAYFDESYDLEKDKRKRIEKIVDTCRDLQSKNWRDIYLQTQALRQHNHDTFFNSEKLSVEINKTLELFLEFADRG